MEKYRVTSARSAHENDDESGHIEDHDKKSQNELSEASKIKYRSNVSDNRTNVAINTAQMDRNNREREVLSSQATPLLHRDSIDNSYNSFQETSSSTSETQSPNLDGDGGNNSRRRPQRATLDEDDLRHKLRRFLDTPRHKWIKRRMMSWYPLGQTVKTFFVSGLVSFII